MSNSNSNNQNMENEIDTKTPPEEEAVKWDYTNRKQTLYTGAAVVGLNLLVILLVILDRTVPAIHSFITGKPI